MLRRMRVVGGRLEDLLDNPFVVGPRPLVIERPQAGSVRRMRVVGGRLEDLVDNPFVVGPRPLVIERPQAGSAGSESPPVGR